MNNLNPLDEAELRVQIKQMYKDIGIKGVYQVLYELFRSAQIIAEVAIEEQNREGVEPK